MYIKDYNSEQIASNSRSTSHPGTIGQKPNQMSSSDLLPPPPYSPDPARQRNNAESSGYGSVRSSIDPDDEQRVGFLGQIEQPSHLPEQSKRNDSEPNWKYANPRIVYYLFQMQTNTKSNYQHNRPGLSTL